MVYSQNLLIVWVRFVNWYRYMDQPEANGQGRGYKLVQHVMLIILEKSNWALLDRLAEYNFDALDLKNFDSLEKRINYNEDRVKILLLSITQSNHLE